MAEQAPRLVRATRVAVVAVLVGLALTGLSVLLHGGWQRAIQYTATAGYVVAWNHLRFAAFSHDPEARRRWVRSAVVDSVKAMITLVGIALATSGVNAIGHQLLTPPRPITVPTPSATPSR